MKRSELEARARKSGIVIEYESAAGKTVRATDAALEAAIRAFPDEVQQPQLPKVIVSWHNRVTAVKTDATTLSLHLEDGSERTLHSREGVLELPLLPPGYHQLYAGDTWALVIAAPRKCYAGEDADAAEGDRKWGVFVPPYAIRSESDSGVGTLSELRRVNEWIASLDGAVVATLPLFAAMLDEPLEPSPYSPASRLFWNETYLDLTAAPELAAAAASLDPEQRQRLRRLSSVDYRTWRTLTRPVIERVALRFFESGSDDRRRAFDEYLARNPEAEAFARFRAAQERHGSNWREWPAWSEGIPPDAFDPAIRDFHLYSQWIADEQLSELAASLRRSGGGLYLDLPLGVHPDGYDAWSRRQLFAESFSVGAPPDAFFTKGQNWGFAPLHPATLLDDRLEYVIRYIAQAMARATILRIDHVMQLYRLYWIPNGAEARDGVYVRYPEEALFAILCLESHRHRCRVVGEDLGTVPQEVRTAMDEHGMRRMYVVQYELDVESRSPLKPPVREMVASVNTHDMPTWSSFARGLDIDGRLDLGLIDEKEHTALHEERKRVLRNLAAELSTGSGENELLDAVHRYIASSDAELALVTLEDLWGETEPQNVPGTSDPKKNWSRKLALTLEEIMHSDAVKSRVEQVRASRAHVKT